MSKATLRIDGNLRGLLQMLQAIKSNVKQHATVVLEPAGFTVRWEDSSKTLQSSIFVKASLFTGYDLPQGRRHSFGVSLALLAETLQVFAATGCGLQLRFPGLDRDLECEMTDASHQPSVLSMSARLGSVEMPPHHSWADDWAEPSSYFLLPGALLKEIISDLEWSTSSNNATVTLELQRDPQRILFIGEGAGKLEIEVPMSDVTGFRASEACTSHCYKHKHLRAAMANIPLKEKTGVHSKVSMDAEGMMKVVHMLSMSGADHAADDVGLNASQQASQGQQLGIIQFMLYAESETMQE